VHFVGLFFFIIENARYKQQNNHLSLPAILQQRESWSPQKGFGL
jgi:hypothetical protein